MAAAVSTYDRFVVVPLLVLLAVHFDRPLAEVMVLAVGHQVAYGLGQPLWGVLSDRYGRVRIIRFALVAGAASAVASALVQDLYLLVVARVLAGGLFGAVVPTVMAYVADRAAPERRRGELSGLMRSIAVGTGSATAISGLVGEHLGWRVALCVPAVLALAAAWSLRAVVPPTTRQVVRLRQSLPGLGRSGVLLVLVLVTVEGALVLGGLQLLPTALQEQGAGPGLAGVLAAVFGVGVVLAAGVVSRLPARVPLSVTAAVGSVALVVSSLTVAWRVTPVTVAVSCLALAVTWAFLHNALQTWISEIPVPGRGLVVSCFAGCLFLGGALGTWTAGPWVDRGAWQELFLGATVLAFVLGVVTVGCRSAYEKR